MLWRLKEGVRSAARGLSTRPDQRFSPVRLIGLLLVTRRKDTLGCFADRNPLERAGLALECRVAPP